MRHRPTRWTIADYALAYAGGANPVEIIECVLQLVTDLPPGTVIGEPLREVALADVSALVSLEPGSLPLYGVPFVVKDNIDVGGVPTTAGCPGFTYVPDADATVVARLRAAGAIPVAKANLDQFATGLVGTRSPYGCPPNVLDASLVPGGSSSGSAVAVALGAVPFSLGTDTAGSGRIPAALNGIVGIKPTVGSASTSGIVPAVRRIDCPSVFARGIGDATLVASLLRAHDPTDAYSRQQVPVGAMREPMRIGVPAVWPGDAGLDPAIEAAFDEAVGRLRALGADIVEFDLAPLLAAGALLYGGALVAERTASIGDAITDGVEGLDPVVASIVARGYRLTAVDAYRDEYRLTHLRAAIRPLWDDVDVIALPAFPHAPTLVEVADDPIGVNERLGRFTTFVNLLDLAAVVVPLRPLAAGLQLIGPAWSDEQLASLAEGFDAGTLPTLTGSAQRHDLVVVGAHLSGLALHHQLSERRARFVHAARTSAEYRLFALRGTVPPKPGLLRVGPDNGAEIDVEVWSMGGAEFATFVDLVPSPLCIGTITLSDGAEHHGFLCEPFGLDGATDITEHGGWRTYLRSVS